MAVSGRKSKPTAQDRLNRLRAEAKKSQSMKGTVQFRLDEESLLLLMQVADQKKVPLGTLVRMWTIERLREEGFSK